MIGGCAAGDAPYLFERHILSLAEKNQSFYLHRMRVCGNLCALLITSFTAFGGVAAQEGFSTIDEFHVLEGETATGNLSGTLWMQLD